MKKIQCNPGCLCCTCQHQNENLKKDFYDTVMCYQEKGKCVKINRLEFRMVEVDDD
jgi:hypothetical protein